jgi:hypothetical protein
MKVELRRNRPSFCKKQNAGPKAGVSKTALSPDLVAVVVVVVVLAIIRSLIMVMIPAMFSADVVAVNPLMVVVGPMAGDPNHFIFPTVVVWAMAVIRPVAYLNAKALRSRGGRK